MQRLEVSGAVRPVYGSLGVKRLSVDNKKRNVFTPSSKVSFSLRCFFFTNLTNAKLCYFQIC